MFNRVIAKWARGGHAKEIFRKAGLGEARVALRMRELMMQNQSLPVAKDMVVHASKILELVGADFSGDDGFQTVVVRAEKQAKPADTGPHRKAVRDDEEKEQITK